MSKTEAPNPNHQNQSQNAKATAGNGEAAPRAETPRTDGPRAPWDIPMPFAMPTPEAFSQMMRDQIARTQSMMDELAVYESVAMQRARTAVGDLAKLASDSIGYVAQLSAEWRKVALDAGRRAADAFGPKN